VTAFSAIEGQDAAIAMLARALERHQLGQAYLFVGPSGVGKQAAAVALARAAICQSARSSPECACEVCRRIAQGIHPDVRVFAPREDGNRNLQVEYLRSEVLPLTKFAPFEAEHAFFVFPQADVSFPVQHPEAANALLKTLEEPRQRVHFLLLSERPDRLLPTIRSRCQRVRFAPLAESVLEQILERRGIAQAARGPAIALAGGRADVALSLCEDERAERLLRLALAVDVALDSGNPAELLELAETVASHDERALVLDALRALYRDVARTQLGVPARAFGETDEVRVRAGRLRPGQAAERVARLCKLQEDLESNANPELALDGLLLTL
jgi:DNA polymerase-3 subunit delta'